MKAKHTIILLAVLGGLVLLATLVIRPRQLGRNSDDQSGHTFLQNFKPDEVDRIEVRAKGKTSKVTRKEGVWVVDSENDFPADETAVAKALKDIVELKGLRLASTKEDKQALFMVTPEKGAEVKLYSGDKLLEHFFIGKITPTNTYLRLADSNNIYEAPISIRDDFDRGNSYTPVTPTWKDRTLSAVRPEELARVTLEMPEAEKKEDRKVVLEYGDNAWRITEPIQAPGDPNKVQPLLNQLARIMAAGFAAPDTPADKLGFDKPVLKVTLDLKDGSHKSLIFGAKEDKRKYYAKRGESDHYYVVMEYVISNLSKTADELKGRDAGEPAAPPITAPATQPPSAVQNK